MSSHHQWTLCGVTGSEHAGYPLYGARPHVMHFPHLTSPNLDGWWRMGEYNVTGILLRTFRESEIWLAYSSEDVSAPRAVQPNCAGVLRRVYSVAQVATVKVAKICPLVLTPVLRNSE